MKIGPVPTPPAAAVRRHQAGEPPLPLSGTADGADARAARFAEFGMFGRKAPPAADRPAMPRAHAAPPRPQPPAPPGPKTSPVAYPAAAGSHVAPDRPDLAQDEARLPARRGGPIRVPEGTSALPDNAPVKAAEIEDSTGSAPAVRPARPGPRRSSPGPTVRLTLREENGAVVVVAGSTPMDPASRALLRRLVEVMLARSGLALAQFQLNGAPLAPITLTNPGGLHGTRTG